MFFPAPLNCDSLSLQMFGPIPGRDVYAVNLSKRLNCSVSKLKTTTPQSLYKFPTRQASTNCQDLQLLPKSALQQCRNQP